MDYDEYENYMCPITKQIFNDPVVCEDGYIYEKEAITHWLYVDNTSPMTRERIRQLDLYPIIQIRTEIEELLKNKPELREIQYRIRYNSDHILEILKSKEYDKIYKYTSFELRNPLKYNNTFFCFI